MGIIPMIKHAVNSTLGTGFFMPLDKLLGAKIVCRGTIGTKFTLTRTDGYYPEMTAEIAENAKELSNGLYAVIVPVPCGNYSIKIDVFGTIMTATVNASAIGQHYTFSYSSYQLLQTFTSNGTFTVPENITTLYISAIGGGGGGGSAVKKAIPLISVEERTLNVTIGAGGIGAPATESISRDNGTDGGATILTGIVNCTLAGGGGGISNDSKTVSPGGSSGGPGGGSGGNCGYFSYAANDYYKDGTDGEDGLLGKGGKYYNTGGGGGASIGDGGSNEYDVYDGNDGIRGGGGSGGGGSSSKAGFSGGNGGNGYLSIYKGVMIE